MTHERRSWEGRSWGWFCLDVREGEDATSSGGATLVRGGTWKGAAGCCGEECEIACQARLMAGVRWGDEARDEAPAPVGD